MGVIEAKTEKEFVRRKDEGWDNAYYLKLNEEHEFFTNFRNFSGEMYSKDLNKGGRERWLGLEFKNQVLMKCFAGT